jgi:uncharacterized protein (DUF697 family)
MTKKDELEKTNGAEPTIEETDVDAVAKKHVKRYMYWSMGAGFIPIPLVDMGAVLGVQLKMLSKISKEYEVEFKENRVKSIVATLLGTLTAGALKNSSFNSFIKTIPIVGILGSFSMPVYSGAATYAIGKIFIQHFASGGTFLDFDPKKVKEHFKKFYEDGKSMVTRKKEEVPA